MAKTVKKTKKSAKQIVKSPIAVPFPGYIGLSKQAYVQIKQSKKLFFRLAGLLSAILFVLTVSALQASYFEAAVGLQAVSTQVASGVLGTLLETGVLAVTVLSGTLSSGLTESQQLMVGLVYLFTWLVIVWLLRHLFLNKTVTIRDGLYSAGAPLVATILVFLFGALQLLPLALLVALLSAVAATGVVNGILIAIGLLLALGMAVLTLYWLVGTFIAGVIVTIPGTYPIAALRSARGVVVGYRGLVLKRVLFLGLLNLTASLAVLIPFIFLDSLMGYVLSWLTVSIVIALNVSLFIYSSTYVYILYRRIIDERSE